MFFLGEKNIQKIVGLTELSNMVKLIDNNLHAAKCIEME